MNKTVKIIGIGVLIIALSTGIAYAVTKRKKPAFKDASPLPPAPGTQGAGSLANTTTTPGKTPAELYADCTFPLQKGSNGKCVELLQKALIARFGNDVLPKYGADSDWGEETETAMILYAQATSIDDPDTFQQFLNFFNP